MEYIATFGSTHKVLKAEKVLKEKDIPFKLIPTPKKLAAFCDLAISFEEKDRKAIENTFRDSSVKAATIYRHVPACIKQGKEGDEYVEV